MIFILISKIKSRYKLQEDYINTIIDYIKNYDYSTGKHIEKTAEYVRLIANELKLEGFYNKQLTNEFIHNLVLAAPLHDIGKLYIPDSILKKTDKLTNDEFEEIKKHPIIGEHIIQEIINRIPEDSRFLDILTMGKDVALYHHEKWDGKGYPYGKSKYDIPLSARIMAVADVMDALVSERCYKESFSYDKAYSIIESESGTHFDPTIISTFCSDSVRQKIKVLKK